MKKITQENNIKIVGIELRTSNMEAMQTMPLFWQKFYQEGILQQTANKVSDNVLPYIQTLKIKDKIMRVPILSSLAQK